MFNRKPEQLALLFALLSMLALLLVVLIDLFLSYQRDLDSGEKRLQQFSVMMAEHTARSFEAVDLLVNEIAGDLSNNRSRWLDWSDVEGWEYIAQRHSRAMPQLRDLIIFDAGGKQRFNSTYFPSPQISIAGRPYFTQLELGTLRTSFGPYIEPNSGRYTYAIARRLNTVNSRFAGIAFAAIEPGYMQDFCWANRLSDNFEAVLTNQAGEIIASCRPADLSANSTTLGRQAGNALFAGRAAGQIPETGLARADGLLISTSPVPGFPDLRLLAIMPTDVALANWQSRLLEIGSLTVLLSLLLFFGTQLLRRQVVELRTMADALRENHDLLETRVQEATAALASEKDTAERANAAKSRFLAAASHDLRQPLHALSLFATDLLRQAANGRLREVPRIAEQISASTQTLGEMLNALLDISRLDIDGVRAEIQTFPLNRVFSRLHDAFHRQADAHRLRLRFHPTRVHLQTDPRLLEQMIGNLISNAIRYTPAGGSILVGVRRQDDKLRIEIRDSGIGIAQEHRAAIFAEFFQVANNAREQDGGLGLGLSIVERLARGLDIQISLASQIGHGTTFSLLLARADAGMLPTAQPTASSGRVCCIGQSAALEACRNLIATWNYEISREGPDAIDRLSADTIILCDADSVPLTPPRCPLIVVGTTTAADLPQGTHALQTPVRPARLRALLRSLSLRRPASPAS